VNRPDIYIAQALRTPLGNLNGALATVPAATLGATVISALLQNSGIPATAIDEVILGQVLTAGCGMNPARQAAVAAGLPMATTAFNVNQVCGSGLRAIALASQQLWCGDARVCIAGGQEAMSQAPHLTLLRSGHKLGNVSLLDSVLHDGLTDAFHHCTMGVTAEQLATRYSFTRELQDAWALRSQQRASAACREGRFAAEIVPVTVNAARQNRVVDKDETIRHDSTPATLARLAPAFAQGGTVTAGNASGINDGAAALLLLTEPALREYRVEPLARIVSWASTGLEPLLMGLGPVSATHKALQQAGWTVDSVDLWEINEAFAAQTLAVLHELALDPERVNVNGGAIALGHPIGASGARILVSLLHELQRRQLRRGVATLCIGGGMGIALCVER